jgi:hypothetical protein
MSERDPDQLADELEREAAKLEKHGEELDENAREVRQAWERKRADPSVPGAVPPGSEDRPAGHGADTKSE